MKNKSKKIILVLGITIVLVTLGIVLPIIVKGDNNDAEASQVLSGKTFTNGSAVGIVGTMKNFAEQTPTVTATVEASDEDYMATIDLDDGYYESVKVNAKPIYDAGVAAGTASLTGGNATEGDILSGKTAYVNGTLLTGSIAQRSAGENITTYGYNSTQGKGYVYFNAGYYPVNNATYGTYAWLTKDQAKALANACGVGYNAGYSAGQAAPSLTTQSRTSTVGGVNGVHTFTFSFAHKVVGIYNITANGGDDWIRINEGTYVSGNTVKIKMSNSDKSLTVYAYGY